jgi:DNA-binding protein H-NS
MRRSNSKGDSVATYIELQQQAEKLMAEAAALREKEIGQVIADIKATMEAYGLTANDLGVTKKRGRPAGKKTAPAAKKKARSAAYKGPNGETWSGRGRRPQWLTKLLKSGKKLEDLAA